ncbi:GTPase HflX [Lentisphaerota bacterium ZTH]|nr:GTPase HflX [Lentisphaerota bacterium]WET07677.1 GTPase HflX [Lentisphaerota bacterium ZTH]
MLDTEKDNRKIVERALLVGIHEQSTPPAEAREHLDELEELVDNLDIGVIHKEIVNLKTISSRYYVGSGKADEILEKIKELEIDCLVFDAELSPSQQRNWEKHTRICVIDRQEVILDIFANRASTREAALQVQLARMEYSLPRLTRAWTHLSRQRGGAKGTRGEGEQQIEVDRRLLKKSISACKRELKEVKKQRATQRKSRKRHEMPHAAIVGYTNAGKSSLLNRLSGSEVLVEDKLFATLDPTTRSIILPNNQKMLLTDTVGFVRKLPHDLVEAFKSTLEEAVLADFLVLVLDISNRHVEEHWETTMSVLKELGAEDKDILIVFNKVDKQKDPVMLARAKGLFPHSVFISAVTGEGIEELNSRMIKYTRVVSKVLHLKIPPQRHDIAALAYSRGKVLESSYDDDGHLRLTVNINSALEKLFLDFVA